jgi:hypothetical protein
VKIFLARTQGHDESERGRRPGAEQQLSRSSTAASSLASECAAAAAASASTASAATATAATAASATSAGASSEACAATVPSHAAAATTAAAAAVPPPAAAAAAAAATVAAAAAAAATAAAAAVAACHALGRCIAYARLHGDGVRHLRLLGASAAAPRPPRAPQPLAEHADRDAAQQHGQSAPLAAAPQLGSCAASGRARRLWAARYSQEEAGPTGIPATASGARADRLTLPQTLPLPLPLP